ncbi:MAG TPA: DUF1127 domain-containing protein [Arenibaculum sp.]|nr:DUF1127 domain-containing protein [Arenibaculum sp.]
MTYTTLSAQDFPKMSVHEIETAVRRARAVFVAGLLRAAFRATASFVGRIGAKSPADELYALDDRMLADLGIARHEIPRVVKHGRDGDRDFRTTGPAANTDVKPQTVHRAA